VAQMKLARSRLQAELQSSAENVAELTGLLADNVVKLRGALREAEQTQRMKDDFLLTLSHELRNGALRSPCCADVDCRNTP
jgi:signal transduction histidine kinase